MRDILFRGKTLNTGKWVKGMLVLKDEYAPNTHAIISQKSYFAYPVSEVSIGQYIGLTDVNGTNIYEGDIVDILTENDEYGVVTYEDGGFVVKASTFVVDFMSNINGKDVEIIGNVFDDFLIDIIAIHFFFFMEDSHSGFIIRQCDIYNKTPFKTCTESGFQRLNISWWFITGDDDLLARCMQMIKSMEEFFLGTFFADDELDIIDQKNIIISVFFTEFRGGNIVFVTDRVDQFVRKFFGSHVQDLCARVIF